MVVIAAHVAQLPRGSPQIARLLNGLHAPGFGAIATMGMLFFRTILSPPIAYLVAAGIAFGLGGIAEAAQALGPRDADPMDLLRNALGIAGFLGAALSFESQSDSFPKFVTKLPAKLLFRLLAAITLAPVLWHLYVLSAQARAFPDLLSFDEFWETEIYTARQGGTRTLLAPTNWPASDGRIASVSVEYGRYPGLEFYPYPDWSGYSCLSFLAAAITPSLELSIRIDSSGRPPGRNTFTASVVVDHEPARYRVSLVRRASSENQDIMDLSSISRVVVFSGSPEIGQTVLLDDFRLESRPCDE